MMSNGAGVELWDQADPVCLCVLNVNHSQTRKSRLTGQAETLSALIDDYCAKSLNSIWAARLKAHVAINGAKRRRVTRGADGSGESPAGGTPADGTPGPMELPDDDRGLPFPGANSAVFLGGAIERVRERCSGDFSVVHQTKAAAQLPGLTSEAIVRDCPGLNIDERALAQGAGMLGRIWFGHGACL